jgi:hypothetical protein
MVARDVRLNGSLDSTQPLVDLVARVAGRFEQQDRWRRGDGALLETIEILLGEAEACPHLRFEPLPLRPSFTDSARASLAASMWGGEPDHDPPIFDHATISLEDLIGGLLRVAAFRRSDGTVSARRVRALFVAAARDAAARDSRRKRRSRMMTARRLGRPLDLHRSGATDDDGCRA